MSEKKKEKSGFIQGLRVKTPSILPKGKSKRDLKNRYNTEGLDVLSGSKEKLINFIKSRLLKTKKSDIEDNLDLLYQLWDISLDIRHNGIPLILRNRVVFNVPIPSKTSIQQIPGEKKYSELLDDLHGLEETNDEYVEKIYNTIMQIKEEQNHSESESQESEMADKKASRERQDIYKIGTDFIKDIIKPIRDTTKLFNIDNDIINEILTKVKPIEDILCHYQKDQER